MLTSTIIGTTNTTGRPIAFKFSGDIAWEANRIFVERGLTTPDELREVFLELIKDGAYRERSTYQVIHPFWATLKWRMRRLLKIVLDKP